MTPPTGSTRRRRRDLRGDEGGYAMVWMAMLMVVMLMFCGLAIDVSNWWLQAQRQQRAADAAALAGVVFMPDSFSTARTIANATAANNRYAATDLTVSQTGRPSQLRVQVDKTIRNFFGPVFGLATTDISRAAVAEYQGAVPMGSPKPYLGQDPDRNHIENIWLNIAGKNATKVSGDRFTAYNCGTGVYGCTSSGNTEYLKDHLRTTNEGYFYAIRVTTPGSLTVQIYDPAFVSTGDTCGSNMPSATTAAGFTDPALYGANPTVRYAGGRTAYCTGDQDIGGANINTAYIMRAPDSSPWDETNNPIINTATCRPQNFRPLATSLNTLLPATNTSADAVYGREVFHRWVTTCTISNAVAGDYFLQVRTNHRPTDPANRNIPVTQADTYDPTVNTGGHNRFSIRVDGGSLSVFGSGRLPLYVNAAATTTPEFYLARTVPSASGRTLKLQFFDIGDVGSGGSVTMKVIPPADSNVGANFTNCTYRVNGTLMGTTSTCTLASMSGGSYQGGLVDVSIPIPSGYACDYSSVNGCWVKVRMTFNDGATPTDTTTWTASIDGDPVRLVE